MNVTDFLLDNGAADEDLAVVTADVSASYGRLRADVAAFAEVLAWQVRKGDIVPILSVNSYPWVVCYLATLRLGAVALPINPKMPAADISALLRRAQPLAGFVERAWLRRFQDELAGAMVISSIPDQSGSFLRAASIEGMLERDGRYSPRGTPMDPGDVAALMSTSGSTGRPRCVMVSHGNLIANTSSILQYLPIQRTDRAMLVLPLHYCFGASVLHTHLKAGATIVIDNRFMFPDKVLTRMRETRCTTFAGVPSHFQVLLDRSSFRSTPLPDLRYVQQAGGRLPERFVRELRDVIAPAPVYVMYGQTEATARLSYVDPRALLDVPDSIGRAIPGVTLRIVDEAGNDVPAGHEGEIVATGRNITLGYWDEPEATAETFRDGWLLTGDLGKMTPDGSIIIVGRKKDFLKCGGVRTSCGAIEEVILESMLVGEVAVKGIPDDLLGEAIDAFVVLADGADPSAALEAIRKHCDRRLEPNLRPKRITIVAALPVGENGKLQRSLLPGPNRSDENADGHAA